MHTVLEAWEDKLIEVFQETRRPDDKVSHTGLRSHLETVLLEQPELDWDFFLTYEDWMGPVMRDIHNDVLAEERKKHPEGSFQGTLGLFNTRVLLRQALEPHSLVEEGTRIIDIPFFLQQRLYYPLLSQYSSLSEAIIDAQREDYPDLRPYHFANTQFIWQNARARQIAHQAMEELFIDRLGWSYRDIPKLVTQKTFSEKLAYGESIGGILSAYHKSPFAAVHDFLTHHPEQVVRNYFKDLQPYHFTRSPNRTWRDKRGRRNLRLARQAMTELFRETLHWGIEEVEERATVRTFRETPIRHGATLGGMLRVVYLDRPKEAIRDYVRHAA